MNLLGRQGSSLKMLGIVKELSSILICLKVKCLDKNVNYIYQLILFSLTASVLSSTGSFSDLSCVNGEVLFGQYLTNVLTEI